ncbi:hypothetical protein BU16DRAFT_529022 [Lophium mytilinum]|uniref:Uncharacterized protein n=1 Tax=Lophium mytilinum TaxID=390894 RepID=A0A6A6QKW2_9PEZI|nr:hypothetical protein BU16DRAFT_529022 [Lophium mytilinum]
MSTHLCFNSPTRYTSYYNDIVTSHLTYATFSSHGTDALTIEVSEPTGLLEWLVSNPGKLNGVTHLRIRFPANQEQEPRQKQDRKAEDDDTTGDAPPKNYRASRWVALLEALARRQAPGFDNVTLFFAASIPPASWKKIPTLNSNSNSNPNPNPHSRSNLDKDRGFGKNLSIIRAVAKLRVQKGDGKGVVLEGFYAQPWRAYLEKELGVTVLDSGTGFGDPAMVRLREWQIGTEYLKP